MIIVLVLPLLNFLLCCLWGRKFGYKGVKPLSTFLMGLSLFFSLIFVWEIIINSSFLNYNLWGWLSLNLVYLSVGLNFDQTTSWMIFLINLISFFVHMFSLWYMKQDPHIIRFLGYLSLFTFFMVVLVTSSNFIFLFVGWEGVGLCSYLLINFWFTRIQANKASIKAMIMNKFGDVGVFVGIIILWFITGSLNINSNFSCFILMKDEIFYLEIVGLLFLLGVMAKSSQIGLHMWLPDAMEGPTPVSALIHAATMVTAGVYLIIKLSPLFEYIPNVLIVIIILGSLTSFFAATIGVTQSDIKKVIAFSTCSQLGYMVLICGFSYYDLGLFHLVNHGVFKALLFLSAGSLIHSALNEQDLRKLGSIFYLAPVLYMCVLIGSFSLMGLPFLTGFYSKDLIIELTYSCYTLLFSFWLSLFSAFLTSFYSIRLIYKSFFSRSQFSKNKFEKYHEDNWIVLFILILLGLLSVFLGFLGEKMILGDIVPVIIDFKVKILPLLFTLVAGILSVSLGYLILVTWKKRFQTPFYRLIYRFISNTWYFNDIINGFLVKFWVNLGFYINYKLIDNQVLETIGPKKLNSKYLNYSSNFSNYLTGDLSMYLVFNIIIIMVVIIMLKCPFDFEGEKNT